MNQRFDTILKSGTVVNQDGEGVRDIGLANGRIAEIVDAEGNTQRLIASPVKFDDDSPHLTRAPQFAEHTDEVIRELGVDDDRLIELKIAGAIT